VGVCRICKNDKLLEVLDLGMQYHTGLFVMPEESSKIPSARLRLVKCDNRSNKKFCGLVQLDENIDLNLMYGRNYGYRSGLNASMVKHLETLAGIILDEYPTPKGQPVLDIGCNDGTTLKYFESHGFDIYGIDPTADKFKEFHPPSMRFTADFFNRRVAEALLGCKKPRIITSFSMLYDLEDPNQFFSDIAAIMDEDTIWVSEQSYLPSMLSELAYDTICHEHIEYYGLEQLDILARRNGLRIIDSFLTNTNGGSLVSVFTLEQSWRPTTLRHLELLEKELDLGLTSFNKLELFKEEVLGHKEKVLDFVEREMSKGKTFAGLGASTKGNVVLQFLGLTSREIKEIGEINPDKIGAFTPGSQIQINSESSVIGKSYDYYIILPWHFREYFCRSSLYSGLNLVFLNPEISIVSPA